MKLKKKYNMAMSQETLLDCLVRNEFYTNGKQKLLAGGVKKSFSGGKNQNGNAKILDLPQFGSSAIYQQ